MKSLCKVLNEQISMRTTASKTSSISQAVSKVCSVIDYVNNMTEDGLVGSYPVNAFKIPSQFSALVLPYKVCMVERGGNNLKKVSTVKVPNVKPEEFEDAWHVIMNALRNDGSITKSLSDCTETKYLSQDLCFRIGEACHYVKGQYPLELSENIKFAFKDYYFDGELDEVFTEFVRDIVMAFVKTTE